MADKVVSAILMMTLHLFFDSLVINVWRFIVYIAVLNLLIDVGIYAKDTSAINKDLCEDVEHRVMDFSRRWHQQGDKSEDDAETEEHDGGELLEVRIPVECHRCVT